MSVFAFDSAFSTLTYFMCSYTTMTSKCHLSCAAHKLIHRIHAFFFLYL